MQKVLVYFDLHRKTWSAKALNGPNRGRVIAKSDYILLKDAVGKVSEAGRQRVLATRRKNVHAGIVGELLAVGEQAKALAPRHEEAYALDYNPFKYDAFVYRSNPALKFGGAPYVYLSADGRSVLALGEAA